jgi:two-component system chemotaxis sensor kinase CheA
VAVGLRKALVHVVRNSVAHGIEDPQDRQRLGKPRAGRIDLSIERRGHRVAIVCRDDGRGLDLDSVRRVAVERGVIRHDAAVAMDEEALVGLLLHGGVSTARTVTEVSGRGVGLDAVRHAVEALDGEVSLRSVAGEGTTVTIVVPASLSTMPALSMQVDGAAVLIPLDSVRRTLRVSQREIAREADGERLVVDGTVLPFLPLRRALNRPAAMRSDTRSEMPSEMPSEMQSAVIVEAEGRLVAVGVDRLGGARSVVVRGIPAHVAAEAIVAGAAFDEDGVVQLVLAPQALVRAASEPRAAEPRPELAAPPRLLVIDDSLTTRMLEQSILESAGYQVDLAVSGEEGLEMARGCRYGVFIVDVEMPGMNGFEFISEVSADATLRDTPAILVTSRSDPTDKRRGKEVGARAYIVKSEFDQDELIDSIRRLVG